MNEIGIKCEQPIVEITNFRPDDEKEIYRQLWNTKDYRAISPGEHYVNEFLEQAKPKQGSHIIDIGCGTGRAALPISLLTGAKISLIDFAENCLDEDVREMVEAQPQALSFTQADITNKLPIEGEYGFCCDVMEHIKPEEVDKVLDNILIACKHVFFTICTVEDNCGQLVGFPLHLSIHPYEWWLQKFIERDCVIQFSRKSEKSCTFYVTAWVTGDQIVATGKVNVVGDVIRNNVKYNIAQGWQQVTPHETNEVECMIIGGGWSLPEFENEIRQKREEGVKLIAINGAYNWCLEKGIIPSALIIVDARPFNARFTRNVIEGCKYFIASQCDPAVFEGLPKDRTYIWHTGCDLIKDLLNEEYKGEWYPIPGGSTALLRALPLFRMLGFQSFHLYGCDSCIEEGKNHHAYEQKENDSEMIVSVMASPSGRIFHGHTWMLSQAQEFMDLIKFIGDEINLNVQGDGLLAHILNTGARLADEEEIQNAGNGLRAIKDLE